MSAPTVTRDGDLITVTMPTDSKREAIAIARKAAGGMVANTGQPVTRKGRSFVFTYSAVTRTAKPADDVRITVTKPAVDPKVRAAVGKAQTKVTTGEDDRLAFLERELARVTALLVASTPAVKVDGPPVIEPKYRKAPKADKPAYVPSPDQARRKAHTCPTCQDLGVVRGSGSRKGQAYVTANGAAQATNAVPCPACATTGKRKRSA